MSTSVASPGMATLLEEGDPADDSRAFRRCLGQYPTGISVVTARRGDALLGMAVNSFAAVSLLPPLILWSIRRESASAAAFCDAGHFAVNVLSAQQVQLSQRFGAPGGDRFAQTPWTPGRGGAPLLASAIAHLECRLAAVHDGGDHFILVGHVERYARYEGEPLLFARGRYGVAQDHPELAERAEKSAARPTTIAEPDASFLRTLSLASQHVNMRFEAHRRAMGVTAASARVLNHLHQGPCDMAGLERATMLGEGAIEDALAALAADGLAASYDRHFQLTEAGHHKREALAARVAEFTQEQLHGMTAADVAAAARVLRTLAQH